MSGPHRRAAALGSALGWTALILVLCLTPGQNLPASPLPEFDKLVHFGMFFGGALLWLWAWPERPGLVVAGGLALGVLTEVLQAALPVNRSGEVLDVAADAAGLLAGLGLVLLLRRRAPTA